MAGDSISPPIPSRALWKCCALTRFSRAKTRRGQRSGSTGSIPDDRARVEAEFARCLHEKTPYRAGFRNVLPDGRTTYQYTTGHPIVNQAGDVVEFMGASMDMTEHWLATIELERASQAVRDLQMKMSRAAQIASVGELAGSIAHEVNQPLPAVVANGHACLRWLSASPPNLPEGRRGR